MRDLHRMALYGSGITFNLLALILLQRRYNLFLYETFLPWEPARPLPHPEDREFSWLLQELPLRVRRRLKLKPFAGAFFSPLQRGMVADADQKRGVFWGGKGMEIVNPDSSHRYSEPEEGYPAFLSDLTRAIGEFGDRFFPWDGAIPWRRRFGIFSSPSIPGEEDLRKALFLIPGFSGYWEIPSPYPRYLPRFGIGAPFSYWMSEDGSFLYREGEEEDGELRDRSFAGTTLRVSPPSPPFKGRKVWIVPIPSPVVPPETWLHWLRGVVEVFQRWVRAEARYPLPFQITTPE